jgi:predicted amidohydrolase
MIRARCLENGVFGVACNYVGDVELAGARQQFPGGGLIVGPRGDVIAQWPDRSEACSMLIADLAEESLLAARSEPEYLYRFRRPELYGPLAQPLAGGPAEPPATSEPG